MSKDVFLPLVRNKPFALAKASAGGGGPLDAGLLVLLGADGMLDPSLVPDMGPDYEQPLTDSQLRASPPAVRDDYDGDVLTEDQLGADAVLPFATGPLALVAVDVDPVDLEDTASYLCRATVDGSAPTASLGWRCRSGQTTYLPVPCPGGTVRVWAPTGVSVSVQGGARA